MTFHIGSQDAHVINNVAGDQWNHAAVSDDDAREQVLDYEGHHPLV